MTRSATALHRLYLLERGARRAERYAENNRVLAGHYQTAAVRSEDQVYKRAVLDSAERALQAARSYEREAQLKRERIAALSV